MDVIGKAYLLTLLTLKSRRLSYGNFMFVENVRRLFYPDTSDDKNESLLDDDARNRMFNKGLNYDKEGKKDDALKCYLKCLVGLKENSRFALLPQCLRNVSTFCTWSVEVNNLCQDFWKGDSSITCIVVLLYMYIHVCLYYIIMDCYSCFT